MTAGKDPKSAPAIVPNRLYRLGSRPRIQVAFAVRPGQENAAGTAAYAGLATLKLPAPGSYRIAVDLPFWIDVVSNGALVRPTDFQGQHALQRAA